MVVLTDIPNLSVSVAEQHAIGREVAALAKTKGRDGDADFQRDATIYLVQRAAKDDKGNLYVTRPNGARVTIAQGYDRLTSVAGKVYDYQEVASTPALYKQWREKQGLDLR